LEEKGVMGVIPAATNVWKFNTFGMTQKQAVYISRVLFSQFIGK